MSSAQGRFTSPDEPLADQSAGDPQSWNLYSYVRNNPLKNIDPSGQDCITTSNQTSSGVEVTTERGGSAETCSGTYVNGTVDVNSFSYNGRNLGYSFSNDTAAGAGTISFGSSQSDNSDWGPGSSNMLGARQIGMTAPIGNALGIGTAAILTAGAGGAAYGALAGGPLISGLGLALPAVPSALQKLNALGLSLRDANAIIDSPASQKLVDHANDLNVNYVQEVGGKLIRITTDPTGQRIISAGMMRASQITNGIANGRFTQK
jgi:hypothetical protein